MVHPTCLRAGRQGPRDLQRGDRETARQRGLPHRLCGSEPATRGPAEPRRLHLLERRRRYGFCRAHQWQEAGAEDAAARQQHHRVGRFLMSPAEDGEPARGADARAPAIRALAGAQTIGEALRLATAALRASGATDTPELDAQVLLAYVSAAARATLLAYPERELPQAQAARFVELVARRLNSEPVAYLTGHREFMGLDFLTDRRALIPRPEKELLGEAALRDIREPRDAPASPPPVVADIRPGSRAIA